MQEGIVEVGEKDTSQEIKDELSVTKKCLEDLIYYCQQYEGFPLDVIFDIEDKLNDLKTK